ncbi:segregation and condensation protein A [Spiroplasma sabaudiense Ar-1343]|uniref:Segregation and condensation protein A n=1 Tax=Spiroplasma sabaudiense Ar-1343 TaxID=1276257 RepID=W6A9I8_9MOLU|nr:segregation/condensation protein A [Spiroplasma sabaudiense]AHI53646.1 segregation and condensation protein A [Spiroplasma sabaudiense Ar-1343]
MKIWNEIKLDNFTGPLDLLLHLIKEKKIGILEVNLLELSNQYIDYINSFVELDVEIASEYLVMGAYLLELKSKSLIPREEVVIDEDFEENQRTKLLGRLVEYHKIKQTLDFFKEKQNEYFKSHSKPKSVIKVVKVDDDSLPLAPINIDLDKFANIFLKIIEKNQLQNPEVKTITRKDVSPEFMSSQIIKILESNPSKTWKLEEFLLVQDLSIQMLVASFLAILDLAKSQILSINQVGEEIEVKYIQKN